MKLALLLFVLSFNVNYAFAANRSVTVQNASYNIGISKAAKSVVSVYASKTFVKPEDNINALYGNDFTNELLKTIDPEIKLQKQNEVGSGVIVSDDGMVITNSHIVADSTSIKIITADNQVYNANILALDKSLDLAILKIQAQGNNFAKANFADSDSVLVGDIVFSLGNPFGIGQSASMGIISAIGRSNFNLENAQYLLQTDAAINPGNSGGALINVDGEIIGINSAMFSKTGSFSGVGFAVPSNAVKFVIDTMNTSGQIQRSWLGIKGQDLSAEQLKSLGLSSFNGVYITNIAENSPAAKSGIKPGDVLLRLHHFNIDNYKSYQSISSTLPVAKKVNAKIVRNSRVLDIEITPQAMKKRTDQDRFIVRGNNPFTGIVLERLSPELNYMLNNPLDKKGIAVIDRPQTISDLNIQVGDILLKVNKTEIDSLESLSNVLNQPAPFGWKIELLRNGNKIKLFIK